MEVRLLAGLAMLLLVGCNKNQADAGETKSQDPVASLPAESSTPEDSNIASIESPAPVATGPCGSIGAADVSPILGVEMKPGEPGRPEDCLFVPATGDVTSKSATFQIQPNTMLFDQMAASGEAVPGIGEKAVILPGSHAVVAVKNGRAYFGSVWDANDPAGARQKSLALATTVVGKM